MKPLDEFGRCIQIIGCPTNEADIFPYINVDIDITDVKQGPVASRTRSNVYGIFWSHGVNRCKLFFSFENSTIYNSYATYLKDLLRYLEQIQIGKCIVIHQPISVHR